MHVVVSKFCDSLPLYRQSEIYEREGVELERSTLAGWVGGASRTLDPLVDALRRYVRIPAKSSSDSNRKAPPIPEESIQCSERSDAGVEIISEVDGFGQIRRVFDPHCWIFLSA